MGRCMTRLAVSSVCVLLLCAASAAAALASVDPARICVVRADYGRGLSVGTGYFVDSHHVLTAAHVVRGARSLVVAHRHCIARATLCSSDWQADYAYLHVAPPHNFRRLRVCRPAAGQRVDVAVLYRVGVPDTPARYAGRLVERTCLRLFWLRGRIRHGDSGAAVIGPGGEILGVAWGVSGSVTAAAPIGPPT